MYLELGVDASHFQAQYPMDPTQEQKIQTSIIYIYGTLTLYGTAFQHNFNLIIEECMI